VGRWELKVKGIVRHSSRSADAYDEEGFLKYCSLIKKWRW